ncbi:uncharacterized protein LOC107632621 [Arachis ipaensis]|uniref:uncharacterized protein LOC107632621 n=1 Tax=Arachis ipaensis TaxID=130454 RepID=UPI0007AF7B6F|nr:uncharacterized protein LOC107632621 [Arachis ipaensis]
MKSPGCVKDVQRLAGRLTALSRFLEASAAKALPFFNLMRKGIAFEWTPACEEAFNHFKKILATPPVLGKPVVGELLYLYLAITEEALAAVLVREEGKVQQPIYFVSKALQGAELRYSKLEKLALALLTSSRRLWQYFQGHQVVVRTDQGIRQVLQKPDLAGRMMTWAIELSQYDIRYEPRHAIKAQVEALAAVLVREEVKAQQPIYFVSKALQGAELRYSKLEKLALALLTSSRRLWQYFQGHQVVVRTDQGIRQVLQKPDIAGRMMTWAIELSQYDLRYEPRHVIKAQAMADFLVEVTRDLTEDTGTRWKFHVDESSNQTSGGAGIILESLTGVIYEQSVKFEFPVSNKQVEYEALLGGLILAREVGATRLEVCSDSQIVTLQVNGSYQARDSLLQKYLERVKELSKQFEEVTVHHVPRERNTRVDILSKLASTKSGTGNHSLIQGITREPAVALHLTKIIPSWMDSITDFLQNGKLPGGKKEAKALRREAAKYTVIQGQLFKKGLSQPLLKCLHPDQTDYWGVDLLRPFPVGPGQVKYLIVAVDYYTKWIEAEPLATISSSNCRKFMWRQVTN